MTSRLFDDDTLPPDVVRVFGDIAPRRRLLYAVAVGRGERPGRDARRQRGRHGDIATGEPSSSPTAWADVRAAPGPRPSR